MSTNQRQYLRFSLDVHAVLRGRMGEKIPTVLQQISVGGCLMPCHPEFFPGDQFRLEIELPSGNYVPLACKAIYSAEEMGMGAKFLDVTKFEQELVAGIIQWKLQSEGLPVTCDPMAAPTRVFDRNDPLTVIDSVVVRESMLEELMAVDPD